MPRVSSNSIPSFSPLCPRCNKEMTFVSVSPTCQSVIYDYVCRNDGDRFSWECREIPAIDRLSIES
jgi:hypothetical protein